MGPLARQGDFYVPEVREAQRWLLGKESEEDGRTDITGNLIIQFTDAFLSFTKGIKLKHRLSFDYLHTSSLILAKNQPF